jgi:hypothetical protein
MGADAAIVRCEKMEIGTMRYLAAAKCLHDTSQCFPHWDHGNQKLDGHGGEIREEHSGTEEASARVRGGRTEARGTTMSSGYRLTTSCFLPRERAGRSCWVVCLVEICCAVC